MARYLIGNVKGPAGISPTVTVTQTSTGATITATDDNGTTTANIRNGIDSDGNNIDLSPYATHQEVQDLEDEIDSRNYVPRELFETAISNVEAPVQSVNGQTGDVLISIPDVSIYATKSEVNQITIPTKTSDLLNDSGYITNSDVPAIYSAGAGIDITNNTISVDTTTVALKSDLSDELPAITSGDAGKVLAVNSGETGVEWITNSGGGGSGGSSVTIVEVADIESLTSEEKAEISANWPPQQIWSTFTYQSTGRKYSDVYKLVAFENAPLSATADAYYVNGIASNNYSFNKYVHINKNYGTGGTITVYSLYRPKNIMPIPVSAYEGKVLTVSSTGGWELQTPTTELPSISSGDAGKVLKVNSGENGVEWGTGGTTYTAGNGISIANDTISVDNTVVATQTDLSSKQDTLTAGSGISITNNIISATGGSGSLPFTYFEMTTTNIDNPDFASVVTLFRTISTNNGDTWHYENLPTMIIYGHTIFNLSSYSRSNHSAEMYWYSSIPYKEASNFNGVYQVDFISFTWDATASNGQGDMTACSRTVKDIHEYGNRTIAHSNFYLKSPDSTVWSITIDNSGNLSATSV